MFTLCHQCNRHARAGSAVCPFCSAALTGAPIGHARPVGKSRAAQILGAAGVALGVATAGVTTGACDGDEAAQDAGNATPPGDAYGGPPIRDSGPDRVTPSGDAYGAPPIMDSSPDRVTPSGDAYGGPPMDGGRD
jgi:hypothetical protein